MVIALNTSGDFDTILDGFEPVTLKRRDRAEVIAIPKAWRFSSETVEAVAGVTDVARNDVVWQFAWDDVEPRPAIGDTIIDVAGACWTILSIVELGAKTRLRCHSRNLFLVHKLDNRVDIEQALWDDLGSGPEIVGWSRLRSAVPARIQLADVAVDTAATPPTSTATYRIVLGEQLVLDHNHRLVGTDGAIYQLIQFAQAARFDVLPIATAIKLVSP